MERHAARVADEKAVIHSPDRRLRLLTTREAAAADIAAYLPADLRGYVLDPASWVDEREWRASISPTGTSLLSCAVELLNRKGGNKDMDEKIVDSLPHYPDGSWEADPREWLTSRL